MSRLLSGVRRGSAMRPDNADVRFVAVWNHDGVQQLLIGMVARSKRPSDGFIRPRARRISDALVIGSFDVRTSGVPRMCYSSVTPGSDVCAADLDYLDVFVPNDRSLAWKRLEPYLREGIAETLHQFMGDLPPLSVVGRELEIGEAAALDRFTIEGVVVTPGSLHILEPKSRDEVIECSGLEWNVKNNLFGDPSGNFLYVHKGRPRFIRGSLVPYVH